MREQFPLAFLISVHSLCLLEPSLSDISIMSTIRAPAGLGIELHLSPEDVQNTVSRVSQTSLSTSSSLRAHAGQASRLSSLSSASTQVPRFDTASLRSIRGMQGLLMAEIGEAMVEFDTSGCGSGFKEGQRIVQVSASRARPVVRSETFLNFGASPSRSSAELESLLGNANSRLKPGATMLPTDGRARSDKKAVKVKRDIVSLEQAKPRARVELDITLENDACVQGSYLRGHIKLRVRKRAKKEVPILLAGAKVRVIGFECISSAKERHTFYHCAAPLSDISGAPLSLYETDADAEGFSQAMDGVHIIPFTMHLPVNGCYGAAKGVPSPQSGVAVRYITMISVKVKDSSNGKRSIAHFYRNCEIWPRINPSVVLAPAARPLQATTSKSITMLSNSKVKLTALLHRLAFIAGQRCYVRVAVLNETKKTVKSLTLTLVRTTTVFKPKPVLDTGRTLSLDPDACETSTTHKVVAETALEMGHRAAKGHASAKGWWTGVGPGEELEFSHFILLPSDALTVIRGRLLEVEYSIRVSLSAGSLTSDVFVTLPIRIINFMSIDPIPNNPGVASYTRTVQRRRSIDGELEPDLPVLSADPWSRFTQDGTDGSHDAVLALHQRMPCDVDSFARDSPVEAVHTSYEAPPHETPGLRIMNPDKRTTDISRALAVDEEDSSAYSSDASSDFVTSSSSSSTDVSATESESDANRATELGNMDLDDPDSDEEVNFVVGRAQMGCADADASFDSCASRASGRYPTGPRRWGSHLERGRKGYPGTRVAARHHRNGAPTSPHRPDGVAAFAQRVQDKLASIAAASAAHAEHPAEEELTPRLGYGADYSETRAPMSSPSPSDFEIGTEVRALRQLPCPPPVRSSPSVSSISASSSHSSEIDAHTQSRLSDTSLADAGLERGPIRSRASSASTIPSIYSFASRPSLGRPHSDGQWSLTSWSAPPSPPRTHVERPTAGMGNTGMSSSSVKGRIAELEERMRCAQDEGSAYV